MGYRGILQSLQILAESGFRMSQPFLRCFDGTRVFSLYPVYAAIVTAAKQ